MLGHHLTSLSNVAQALTIYDQVRRPHAIRIQEKSIINGRFFGLQLNGVDFDEHPERLPELGDAIKENWKWGEPSSQDVPFGSLANFCVTACETTIDGAVQEAIQMLESSNVERAHL